MDEESLFLLYILGFMILILLFYICFILLTQWLKLEIISVPLGLNKKILHLSDLHVEKLRISPKKIETIIQKEAPDFIVLTGDFMRRNRSISLLEPYLTVIQKSNVPAYAILGNHDYLVKPVTVCIDLLKKYDITVLRNEWLDLEQFVLIGLDQYHARSLHIDVNRAFENVPTDKPSIVMAHDPNIIKKLHQKFDLMLSGHLHGKQFNIPFFFHFIKKGPLAKEGIYKGLHHYNGHYLYISKGIGQSGYNVRFGVRSEVSILYV